MPSPFVPVPQPAPYPVPEPLQPGTPFPGLAPTPGSGTLVPYPIYPLGPNIGQAVGSFGSLFRFDIDWRWLGAFLFVLLTVAYAESRGDGIAWTYVGILLLGMTLVSPTFLSEIRSIIGG